MHESQGKELVEFNPVFNYSLKFILIIKKMSIAIIKSNFERYMLLSSTNKNYTFVFQIKIPTC